MTSNIHPWSNLPFAKQIDDLMASAITYSKFWKFSYNELHANSLVDIWNSSVDLLSYDNRSLFQQWENYWEALCQNHCIDVDHAARDAIFALFIYDNCSYLLESSDGEIGILSKFGIPAAILMTLAVKSLNKIKESQKS